MISLEKNNLEKLLQKIENDEQLSELGKLNDKTKELLKRMTKGEIDPNRAIEKYLKDKEKL